MKEYFPLFVSSKGKKALVIGGGKIAARRISTLIDFEFDITVVAPSITKEIRQFAGAGIITYIEREFTDEDLDGKFLVVAATDKREVNKYIGERAKELGAYVSVADVKEECNFYFPAVIVKDEVVIGVTSGGKSHKRVKDISNIIRKVLNHEN
ncbi:MAG TPA: bifunctional precorrin-2 dehydrogenase/sirohydrochlorin ferrochelatase [Acetivibrio sp.]|uniref:precorrin-2 dehydrogenase/sirohydrochlorin ferrochelatase family protein n=1 Tax=Acetivibrio sp. TaxID=1872092 RepID=UPI002C8FA558|nr:bifunctional precorrin-2 dehydrogenase/sirohydrochlorin ferrochelatase [Acetivibrio sp.]HOM01598.1 bifunctional precorrin-2 dehydrogenase/sirohydrochlorin ferrochelatase [Acetivibrio sp.]